MAVVLETKFHRIVLARNTDTREVLWVDGVLAADVQADESRWHSVTSGPPNDERAHVAEWAHHREFDRFREAKGTHGT